MTTDSTMQHGTSSFRAWLLASRPATLTAAVAPVLVGTAVAFREEAKLQLFPVVATFVGASLLQIASNFANDVFDFEKGADTEERLGPMRAVQAGLLSAQQMKRGLGVVILLALLIGVYLTSVAGYPIVVIGVLSILAAIAYTGGPYPLGYNGLGDIFVLIFFGYVAVCGAAFVHLGALSPLSLLAATPLGALATNILVVNNLRDRHTDVKAGKRTLAVRFGRRGALAEYVVLGAVSYLTPVVLVVLRLTGPWALLPVISLPLYLKCWRGVSSHEGKALNAFLVLTAKLVFVFGALFAMGLSLDAYLNR